MVQCEQKKEGSESGVKERAAESCFRRWFLGRRLYLLRFLRVRTLRLQFHATKAEIQVQEEDVFAVLCNGGADRLKFRSLAQGAWKLM